jgi:hypothetical protein
MHPDAQKLDGLSVTANVSSSHFSLQTIHFTLYENITRRLNPTGKYDPQTHVVAGALSGGLAAAATTPLDVIKTVLNTQEARTAGEKAETRGMMDAARTVYQLKVGMDECNSMRFFFFLDGSAERVLVGMSCPPPHTL